MVVVFNSMRFNRRRAWSLLFCNSMGMRLLFLPAVMVVTMLNWYTIVNYKNLRLDLEMEWYEGVTRLEITIAGAYDTLKGRFASDLLVKHLTDCLEDVVNVKHIEDLCYEYEKDYWNLTEY